MPRYFTLPHFAAASAAFVGVTSAAVSFAQETPPLPAAPPTPPTPTAPAAPADPKAQTEAEKKQFVDAVKAYNQAIKAYSDADRKRLTETVNALKSNNMAVRSYGYATSLLGGTRLPSQTISLDLKNVSARDAVAKVLNEAKLDYIINDDFPNDTKLSLSVSGIQVSTALDLVTQSAGVRWAVEKRDNKIIVRVGKNVFKTVYPTYTFNGATPGAFAPFLTGGGVRLPKVNVSLNLKNASAREALVMLLEKQNLAYEIADDFPKDAKISLVVQDADLSSVLDTITRSVGFQWVAEKRDGKIMVRVGKNVANGNLPYRLETIKSSDGTTRTHFSIGEPFLFTGKPAAPLIYQYQTTEQRSTFTCPRCGKKTTVVQKSTRSGSSSGGAKATDHEDWHYCPYCGKKVAAQNAPLAAPLWQTDTDENAAIGTGETEMPSLFFPALPVFDTSFSDNPALFEEQQ